MPYSRTGDIMKQKLHITNEDVHAIFFAICNEIGWFTQFNRKDDGNEEYFNKLIDLHDRIDQLYPHLKDEYYLDKGVHNVC